MNNQDPPHPTPPPSFELAGLSIAQLQQGQADGQWSAADLARLYIARIDQLDRGPDGLNALLEINSQVLAQAATRDAERRAGKVRSPLHGIPLVLKDNIETDGPMLTTAGSLALEASHAGRDAFIARRLQQAGALIVGKANLSEWANFRSSRPSSGWSGRGGQTRNPYALDRTPSGSSSGSGAAVAADFCAGAVGTETDGSIVGPASALSVVGLKPTLGLISRSGIIPIAHSQDTAGPMARSVADAALLLNALAGTDPQDNATTRADTHCTDYTADLDAAALKGARLGVARHFFGFHEKVDALMEEALAALRAAGAELIDPIDLAPAADLGRAESTVLHSEFKYDLNAYLASRTDLPVANLAELIAFNQANHERTMPYFGQERFLQAQEQGPLSEKTYTEALAACRRLARAEGLDRSLKKDRLDAIVAPTGGLPWKTDLINGDHYGGGGCSQLAAVAGYPHISVPTGYIFGLPVNLSFFAGPWREAHLLRLAYAFEQTVQARRAPRFLPCAEI